MSTSVPTLVDRVNVPAPESWALAMVVVLSTMSVVALTRAMLALVKVRVLMTPLVVVPPRVTVDAPALAKFTGRARLKLAAPARSVALLFRFNVVLAPSDDGLPSTRVAVARLVVPAV